VVDVASVEISHEACTFRKEINEMMTYQKTKIPELQHHRRRHNNAADYLANCAMNSKKDTSEFACPEDPGAAGGWDDLRESSTQIMTQPRSSGESSSAFTGADLHLPAVGNVIETEIVDDDEYNDIEEAERAALSQSSCGMGSKAGFETEIVGEGELAEIAAIEASYSWTREQHHGGDGGIQTEIVGEDELSVIDAAMSQSSHLRSPPGNLSAWMPGSTSGAAAASPALLGREPSSQRSTGRKTPGLACSSHQVEEDRPVENFLLKSSSSFSCRHSAQHAPDAEIERILLDSPPTKQHGAVQDAECGASDGGHRPPEGANRQASVDGIERILVESPPATAQQGQRVDDGCGASGGGHRHAAGALSSRGGDASGVLFIDDPEDSANRHQLEGDSEREEGSNEVCPIANRGGFASGDLSHLFHSFASGDGVGARMVGQTGYIGGGLGGNDGQGIHEPIQARPRAGRAGLGGERGYGEGGSMNARPKEVEVGLGGENGSLELDERQMAVYKACMGSKNVFLTGKGGSGKTFLLKVIYVFPLCAVQSVLPRPGLFFVSVLFR
jgi:hypothetical protein